MLDVSRTASYEINLVRLPVRQLLLFLKTGSLVFSDIVHDDSCPWYLVTDEGRFLKKEIEVPNLGQIVQNQARN